ncbi:MAG: sigma-70 family RNA polymerase sigma factor [Candidatus Cloacimonetes bacterium]|nr:sigma-70 family RNA polymerase sigma factor [Candidatus Cloacimonadota bacterium]
MKVDDIYLKTKQPMTKYVEYRYNIPVEDAEDIFHNAFLYCYNKRHEIRDFETYLLGCVIMRVRQFFRKRKQMHFVEYDMPELTFFDNPEKSFKILKQVNINVLDILKKENKSIFEMRYFDKKTLKEIAQQKNKSITLIHNTLDLCIKQLKKVVVENSDYDHEATKLKIMEVVHFRNNCNYKEIYIDRVFNDMSLQQLSKKYKLSSVQLRGVIYYTKRRIENEYGIRLYKSIYRQTRDR